MQQTYDISEGTEQMQQLVIAPERFADLGWGRGGRLGRVPTTAR
jgi:hypothetical protein